MNSIITTINYNSSQVYKLVNPSKLKTFGFKIVGAGSFNKKILLISYNCYLEIHLEFINIIKVKRLTGKIPRAENYLALYHKIFNILLL